MSRARTGLVAGLVLLNAGWMAFDGARALVVGDYVTPRTGKHAGQLGPWADVVRAVGVEPRSASMKTAFVVYGGAFLVVLAAFLGGAPWGRKAMIVAAIAGLWHVPFGTLCNLLVILLLAPQRSVGRGGT